jgi:hypothetical protein
MIYNWLKINNIDIPFDAIAEKVVNLCYSHNTPLRTTIFPHENSSSVRNKRKRTPRSAERQSLWNSSWGWMLNKLKVADPQSWIAKKFRRRFRVPYPMFTNVLVPMCQRAKVFGDEKICKIPIEFKIMAALRMLGIVNIFCICIAIYENCIIIFGEQAEVCAPMMLKNCLVFLRAQSCTI